MTRINLGSIRSGPTTVVGDATTTMTLASVALSSVTSGMANGDVCHVDIVVSLTSTADYSALVTLTVAVGLSAGPTYTLGSVTTQSLNSGPSGTPVNSGLTVDQNSGNLRVRAVLGSITVIARGVYNTIGP
jgi:hypothetical protein